ncbi:unnamed protein product [Wuchereria bancrofti]|uniref:Uncharacterized protein n=1 Tax=Wuchereria bancrofti TaxID=6293 RepID=A0A3P7FMA8_WUCBA|nr:unnamed protein product [Wuchereria bancrofti]
MSPHPPIQPDFWSIPWATKQEFEQLKKEVEDMKKLLIRAKEYDEKTGQPDCEMEEKVALLKKVAELVGVDLSEIFDPTIPQWVIKTKGQTFYVNHLESNVGFSTKETPDNPHTKGIDFTFEHPDRAGPWHSFSNYVVLLSTKNEKELIDLIEKCEQKNLKYSAFREPDLGNSVTAIAIEPSEVTQKLVAHLPLLFTNHDGVICLSSEWGSRHKNKEGFDSLFDRFNTKAIKVLNEIIEETDCEIVTSSDWRHHTSLKDMRKLFDIRGIKKGPIGFTDLVPSSVQDLEWARSQEIIKWLDVHRMFDQSWVAVDDMDMSTWLTDHFVQTPRSSEGCAISSIIFGLACSKAWRVCLASRLWRVRFSSGPLENPKGLIGKAAVLKTAVSVMSRFDEFESLYLRKLPSPT